MPRCAYPLLQLTRLSVLEQTPNMQIDMHYYGTYAIARAAGIRSEIARTIATAAQYVDDNAGNHHALLKDGTQVNGLVTAHHWHDIANLDEQDQRFVWVPFHFLPGNEGDEHTEKLICRMNSRIAREMVEHNLSLAERPYAAELIGITAHVYADTFAHYGFSGVSSRWNKVHASMIKLEGLDPKIEEYVGKKARDFFNKYGDFGGLLRNFRTAVYEGIELASGALGHGSVATYPDRPYLQWQFTYERSEHENVRDNPKTYLEASQNLHEMFRLFLEKRPDLSTDTGHEFSSIEEAVREILSVQAQCEGRIEAWQQAARRGALFTNDGEEIPPYNEDEWHNQCNKWGTLEGSKEVVELPTYRFMQAATIHRTFVLRDLLPAHEIVLD
jgi:hypothetical protein